MLAGQKTASRLDAPLQTFANGITSPDDVEPCNEIEASGSRSTCSYHSSTRRDLARGLRRKLLDTGSLARREWPLGNSYRLSALRSEHLLGRAASLENDPRKASSGLHPMQFYFRIGDGS